MQLIILLTMYSIEETNLFVKEQRKNGKKIILTNGCFDVLHKGHVAYLNESANLGDCLIVGINSDISVKKLKGPIRPLNSEYDRCFLLSNIKCVDNVFIFNETTIANSLDIIKPDVWTKAGDYNLTNINQTELLMLNKHSIEAQFLSFVDGFSTTKLIEKLTTLK